MTRSGSWSWRDADAADEPSVTLGGHWGHDSATLYSRARYFAAKLLAQVWDAKPLPPDVKHVPNNAIICTRSLQQDGADGDGEAPGVLGLSGGDHDGDEVDISFDPDLVAFVTATQQFRGRA